MSWPVQNPRMTPRLRAGEGRNIKLGDHGRSPQKLESRGPDPPTVDQGRWISFHGHESVSDMRGAPQKLRRIRIELQKCLRS